MARTARRRHLRHGRYDRLRRSDNFSAFLAQEQTDLNGTGTGVTVTIGGSVTQATGALTLAAQPVSGDRITLGDVTYTFKDTLSAANDVLIDPANAAIATLTLTGQPANTETVTIGAKTYTFQTTLTNVNGNVFIGASASATLDNLIAAVNLAAGAGTLYAAATTAHPTASAAAGAGDTAVFTALTAGTGGNSLASTETIATNGSFGAATFAGGSAASVSVTCDNLIAAVNDSAGEGTLYGTGTVANPLVTAAAGTGDTVDFTAVPLGDLGNGIVCLGEFDDATNTTPGTLTGGAGLDTISKATHGYVVGDGPFVITAATTLPTGYTAGTLLWISAIPTAGTFKVVTKRGSDDHVQFNDDGTGTLTFTKSSTEETIYELLKTTKPVTIAAATDVDAL